METPGLEPKTWLKRNSERIGTTWDAHPDLAQSLEKQSEKFVKRLQESIGVLLRKGSDTFTLSERRKVGLLIRDAVATDKAVNELSEGLIHKTALTTLFSNKYPDHNKESIERLVRGAQGKLKISRIDGLKHYGVKNGEEVIKAAEKANMLSKGITALGALGGGTAGFAITNRLTRNLEGLRKKVAMTAGTLGGAILGGVAGREISLRTVMANVAKKIVRIP